MTKCRRVISADGLESLAETRDIMVSPALLSDIQESLAELVATEPAALTKEDLLRLIATERPG